jgi:transcriptional regulator with XRE-family HTH domain
LQEKGSCVPVREARQKPRADEVVAAALVRAARRLGLSQSDLAAVLGTSAASVSRTWNGDRPVAPDSAEGRLALLFLRVFRSLDTLVGGDEEKARRWLDARNAHLGGQPPRELLASTPGLVRVAEYLDAMRGTL